MMKGLLPSGTYHFTVRQSYKDTRTDSFDDSEFTVLCLVWTVDEDTDYAWRNIIEEIPINEFGLGRLESICSRLNFNPYPKDHPEFYEQFVGLRTKLLLTVGLSGNYRKNIILEHQLPTQPPHFDVTSERSDEHFYHTSKSRTLPI